MRVRRLIGGSAWLDGWGAGGEREGDSLVVQHGSVGTARFLGVVSVGRSVCARRCRCVATRVCVSLAWTMQGQSRRRALLCATGAPSANGSAFPSIRLDVKTRNISRRFFLSSILPPPPPLRENSSSSFLKRTRPPRQKGRASARRSRDEENGGSKPRIEPDPETRLFRFRGNIIYTIRSNKKNPTPNSPPARAISSVIEQYFNPSLGISSFYTRCNYHNSNIDDVYALSYRFVVFRNVHAHAIRKNDLGGRGGKGKGDFFGPRRTKEELARRV